MASYNAILPKFTIIGKLEVHPFYSETVVISSADCQRERVHHIIPHKKSHCIRIILNPGEVKAGEFLEFLNPPSMPLTLTKELNFNWWIETRPWIRVADYMKFPLSVIIIGEDYLAAGETDRKMETIVNFYNYFVVCVIESKCHYGLHAELFKHFFGASRMKLPGEIGNTYWLYYDPGKVLVQETQGGGICSVDIGRRNNGDAENIGKRARLERKGDANGLQI